MPLGPYTTPTRKALSASRDSIAVFQKATDSGIPPRFRGSGHQPQVKTAHPARRMPAVPWEYDDVVTDRLAWNCVPSSSQARSSSRKGLRRLISVARLTGQPFRTMESNFAGTPYTRPTASRGCPANLLQQRLTIRRPETGARP